jgi:hypothetical protein
MQLYNLSEKMFKEREKELYFINEKKKQLNESSMRLYNQISFAPSLIAFNFCRWNSHWLLWQYAAVLQYALQQ